MNRIIQTVIVLIVAQCVVCPDENKTAALTLDLTKPETARETVLIREGGSDEYIFKKILDMTVDSKGNVYLLGVRRILKYDNRGRFVRYIGSIGQGPGEFNFPRSLAVGTNDGLYVLDYRRIFHYNSSGKFLHHFDLTTSMHGRFFIPSPGKALGMSRSLTDSGMTKSVCSTSLKTGEVKHLYLVPDRETIFKGTKSSGVMGGFIHPYSSEILLAPLPGGAFCFASNYENKILIVGKDGEVMQTIRLKQEPQPISSEEFDLFDKKYGRNSAKRLKLSSTRPVLSSIVTDETGKIYAILKKPLTDSSLVQTVEVFDRKGKYLYRLKMNFIPKVIFKKNFYGITKNNDDQPTIKKLTLLKRGEGV